MQFYLLLWLSQQPSLLSTERGFRHLATEALLFTQDQDRVLLPYERSLLTRIARGHLTLGHALAYLREHDQA